MVSRHAHAPQVKGIDRRHKEHRLGQSSHPDADPDDWQKGRRCVAICRVSNPDHPGEQCRRYATTGSRYCRHHGGRKREKGLIVRGIGKDPAVARYRGYLRKTLQDRLDECAEIDPSRVTLHEELEVVRMTAVEAVRYYDAIAGSDDPKISIEAKALAGQMLRAAMSDVQGVAEGCAKLESMATDKISLRACALFLEQVVRVMVKELRAVPELATWTIEQHDELGAKLEKAMRRQVKFPEVERSDGPPALAPALTAAAMDATVLGSLNQTQTQRDDDDDEDEDDE